MDEQLNIFDKIGNIISIVAGILFLIASLFPWIGMILKAVSIQGVNVLDAKGYSKNLFQYGVNNHIELVIYGALIMSCGLVLIIFSLFLMLERKHIELSIIKVLVSVIGIIGTILGVFSNAIRTEIKAQNIVLETAPDLAVKITPWGMYAAIAALVVIIVADIFCVIGHIVRERER